MKNFIKKYLTFNHCWLKKIGKNKTIEAELYTSPLLFDNLFSVNIGSDRISFCFNILNSLFSINFKIDWKCSNAGIHFRMCLFGLVFGFYFYDNRDWDYENDKWLEYEKS